ncbi:dehydratase [Conexibacter sp. W3-3-2]|uniref:Dehydratase n=1 Tax=Paraconexibacter algicola TaxID=2133960 RepID=A0A2T4UBX4_9ACTN|nr:MULTISPECIES: MaoC/PaaZ C-terminal domain-containing protein [Solirubrobacterales]MTD44256.1 dehydratase [Conexibacter sp. W3-3-2]PTL54376.1 dehydratase [Paraconexibacter algicola]
MFGTAPWFDDLQEGASVPGRGRTVTEADVVAFATLTGDFHPQHVDEAWSADGPFGGRVAHGMLIASYAVGLLQLPFERIVALRRVKDLTFKRPVRLGDTIRAEATIEALRDLDDQAGMVTCRVKVLGAGGQLVARMAIEVLWRREQPVAAPEEPSVDDALASLARPRTPAFVAIPF